MTVRDLCGLFDYHQKVEIYDSSSEQSLNSPVFEGTVDCSDSVLDSEFCDEEVVSVESLQIGTDVLTIYIAPEFEE